MKRVRWAVLRCLEPGMQMTSGWCFLFWIVPVPFGFYEIVFDAWRADVYWPRAVQQMADFDPTPTSCALRAAKEGR